MWLPCLLDNYEQYTLVRKRWVDTDLWFFSSFNTLVRWAEHSLTPFWNSPPLWGSWTSYIFVARFQLESSPYRVLPSTPERKQVVPSLPPVISGTETLTFTRACARDFEFRVFLCHFRPCYLVTTVWFIDLLIYSFNFPWAVQLRYITSSRQSKNSLT